MFMIAKFLSQSYRDNRKKRNSISQTKEAHLRFSQNFSIYIIFFYISALQPNYLKYLNILFNYKKKSILNYD